MKLDRSIWIFGILSIFLAFAPFYPEPHLIGKLNWIMGGGVGMNQEDYFDLFLHGGPVVVFLVLIGMSFGKRFKSDSNLEKIKKHSAHKKGIAA